MSKVSDYNLYDIDALIKLWKRKGWKGLAELGANFDISCNTRRVPYQIMRLFDEVYEDIVRKLGIPLEVSWIDELLTLAAMPKGEIYTHDSYSGYGKDNWGPTKYDAKLRRLLKRVSTAFVNSKSVVEALSKINKENWPRLAKCWFYSETEGWIDEVLSSRIDRKVVEATNWLLYGLRGRKAYEEAFWNCIWLFTKPMITEMMEIRRCIVDDIPLTDEQMVYLDSFMGAGYPRGCRDIYCDGSETYNMFLEIETERLFYKDPLFYRDPPFYEDLLFLTVWSHTLLIRPAFRLAQELQRKYLKPRFVKQCRAPSCGKRFWTGRKSATNCPGSQGYKKNKCSLEWNRYRRFLQRISKNPEKDWNNKQLQKDFISYDES